MSKEVFDPINPSHYKDGKIETWEFIEDKNLGYHLGNAVKYISKAGKKNPDKEIEDLNKAIRYINRYIQLKGQDKDSAMSHVTPEVVADHICNNNVTLEIDGSKILNAVQRKQLSTELCTLADYKATKVSNKCMVCNEVEVGPSEYMCQACFDAFEGSARCNICGSIVNRATGRCPVCATKEEIKK